MQPGATPDPKQTQFSLDESFIPPSIALSGKSPAQALADLQHSFERNSPLRSLLVDIRNYYNRHNWSLLKISQVLDTIGQAELSANELTLLCQAVQKYMGEDKQLGSLLSGFVEITDKLIWSAYEVDDEQPQHISLAHLKAYSEVRNFLIRFHRTVSTDKIKVPILDLADLTEDTVNLIASGGSSLHLRIFYAAVVRCCLCGSAPCTLKDRDLQDAFAELRSFNILPHHAKTLLDIITNFNPAKVYLSDLITDYVGLIKLHFDSAREQKITERWKQASESLVEAAAKNRLAVLLELYKEVLPRFATPATYRFLASVIAFHYDESFTRSAEWEHIKKFTRLIVNSQMSIAYLANYSKAVQAKVIANSEDSLKLLKTMSEHALGTKLLLTDSTGDRAKALADLRFITETRSYDSESLENALTIDTDRGIIARNNSWQNKHGLDIAGHEQRGLFYFDKMYDHFHGYGALTVECKRPPNKEPPLLARFANDLGKVRLINAREIGEFPGRGFLIKRLDPRRIFAADKTHADPFHHYRDAWPGLAEQIDDLINTAFIFCRGMIVIGCHHPERYNLSIPGLPAVSYSYVFFNEHFKNPLCKVAYLVPTILIKNKFRDSFIEFEDYKTFDPDKPDINKIIWSPETLADLAAQVGLPIFEVGRAGNITRGFSQLAGNSVYPYMVNLKKLIEEHNEVMDEWNKGVMYDYGTDKREKALNRIRALKFEISTVQTQVANLGSRSMGMLGILGRYHNLFDLFRISLALWHKGQTADSGVANNEAFQTAQLTPSVDDIGEAFFNPSAVRMLVEAYVWHKEGHESGLKKKDFPVLVLANTLDYWRIPPSPFVLDTWNLTLNMSGETIELPQWSNGRGEEEVEVWTDRVLPLAQSTLKDLRFYDREAIGEAQEL